MLAKIGEVSKFELLRNGKNESLDIELIAPPETPKRDLVTIKGRNPLDGVTVANLSPALMIEIGMDDMASGVAVVATGASTNGINIGWSPGDIILEMNGTKITSTAQLEKIVTGAKEWKIVYQRGANINSITITM